MIAYGSSGYDGIGYVFSADDEAVLHAAAPRARVIRVSGKDLFWYGAWTIDAIARLVEQLAN